MFEIFEQREAMRNVKQFAIVTGPVVKHTRKTRPATSARLSAAALTMVHFTIDSTRCVERPAGQWRIERALAAGRSAERSLKRLHRYGDMRVPVSAAMETLERAIRSLEEERK